MRPRFGAGDVDPTRAPSTSGAAPLGTIRNRTEVFMKYRRHALAGRRPLFPGPANSSSTLDACVGGAGTVLGRGRALAGAIGPGGRPGPGVVQAAQRRLRGGAGRAPRRPGHARQRFTPPSPALSPQF